MKIYECAHCHQQSSSRCGHPELVQRIKELEEAPLNLPGAVEAKKAVERVKVLEIQIEEWRPIVEAAKLFNKIYIKTEVTRQLKGTSEKRVEEKPKLKQAGICSVCGCEPMKVLGLIGAAREMVKHQKDRHELSSCCHDVTPTPAHKLRLALDAIVTEERDDDTGFETPKPNLKSFHAPWLNCVCGGPHVWVDDGSKKGIEVCSRCWCLRPGPPPL